MFFRLIICRRNKSALHSSNLGLSIILKKAVKETVFIKTVPLLPN